MASSIAGSVSASPEYFVGENLANVFAQGIEGIWMSETLKQRKRDMLEGRLLDVCAKCQGVK